MSRGGKLFGDFLGVLGGIALFLLGIGLLFFWVGGTWMHAPLYFVAGVACLALGGFLIWYFGR